MRVRPFVAPLLAAFVVMTACAPGPSTDLDAAWARAVGECFTNPDSDHVPDLRFLGPVDTPDNAQLYSSTDGSCSGELRGTLFILRAPSTDAAAEKCAEWNGLVYSGLSGESGYWPGFPGDGYICHRESATP